MWENGVVALGPAKSTRIVRTLDTRGNEVRTKKHVHTGKVFELVSWENKTYAPTHKVISTERSDGKTFSADYICTGAAWTIDENGVRTDNTFDAAKRLKTSARRGARGDATAWSYDAATGLLLSKTDAAGAYTNYTYTETGLLATRTWARGIVTTYGYDAWNQLVSTTYSDTTPAVSQTYDALGRVVSVSDASGTRTNVYDADGNLTSETFAGINKKRVQY